MIWTTVLAKLNNASQAKLEHIRAKAFEARRAKLRAPIDLDARNVGAKYAAARTQQQPPRLTRRMAQQRKEEHTARRTKRDSEDHAALDGAIAARGPRVPVPVISLSDGGSDFWETAAAELVYANANRSAALIPLVQTAYCNIFTTELDFTSSDSRTKVGRECFVSAFSGVRPDAIVEFEVNFFSSSITVCGAFIAAIVLQCEHLRLPVMDILSTWRLKCVCLVLIRLPFEALSACLNQRCASPWSKEFVATPMKKLWRESFVHRKVYVARRVIALVESSNLGHARQYWEHQGFLIDDPTPKPMIRGKVQNQYCGLGDTKTLQGLVAQIREYEKRGKLPRMLRQ